MNQCFKCQFLFPSQELKKFPSQNSYCATCILGSLYRCEYCDMKFILGDFSADYNEGKKLAWKAKLEHTKSAHG